MRDNLEIITRLAIKFTEKNLIKVAGGLERWRRPLSCHQRGNRGEVGKPQTDPDCPTRPLTPRQLPLQGIP